MKETVATKVKAFLLPCPQDFLAVILTDRHSRSCFLLFGAIILSLPQIICCLKLTSSFHKFWKLFPVPNGVQAGLLVLKPINVAEDPHQHAYGKRKANQFASRDSQSAQSEVNPVEVQREAEERSYYLPYWLKEEKEKDLRNQSDNFFHPGNKVTSLILFSFPIWFCIYDRGSKKTNLCFHFDLQPPVILAWNLFLSEVFIILPSQ